MRYFITFFIIYSSMSCAFVERKEITWSILNSNFPFKTYGEGSKIDSIKINNKIYSMDINTEDNYYYNVHNIKSSDSIYQANRLKDSEMEIIVSFNGKYKSYWYSIYPDCKNILSIIGEEMIDRSYSNNEKTGETTQSMTEIFDDLKKNSLKNILSGIKSINDISDISKSCLTTFHLLKFIDNDKYYGYRDRDFELTENIKKSIIGSSSQ